MRQKQRKVKRPTATGSQTQDISGLSAGFDFDSRRLPAFRFPLFLPHNIQIKTTWAEKKRFTVALAAMANRIMQIPSECHLQRAWWNPESKFDDFSFYHSEMLPMGEWLQWNTDTGLLWMTNQGNLKQPTRQDIINLLYYYLKHGSQSRKR